MVKEKISNNEATIENLTQNLGEDNLAKTRAFADMLVMDPSIYGNIEKLNEIKDRLMVNELHIIDEDGIITSSTIDSYIGFDMKSGEQSNTFMVIVDDPSIEIGFPVWWREMYRFISIPNRYPPIWQISPES